MADWYRLLMVVDVLDGTSPDDMVRDMGRRHGDVLRHEVIDDDDHGAEAHGGCDAGGPEAGALPHAMDA